MTMRAYLEHKKLAMLMASNRFFLPSGMSADNVLAAYQFKGVSSEASALLDLSGHNRTLTKGSQTYSGTTYSPTWSVGDGYTFSAVYQGLCGYLDNSSLNNQQIKCIVVRYSGMTQNNRCWLATAGGSDGLAQLTACTTIYEGGEVKNHSGAGYVDSSGHWSYSTTAMNEGVVGANIGVSNGLYVNGLSKAVTRVSAWTNKGDGASWRTFGNTHAPASDLNNAVHAGKKIICAAFFSVALTAEQHKEVADMMAEI